MFNSEQVEHEIVGMFSDDDNEDEHIEQEARRAAHQRRQHRAPTEQEWRNIVEPIYHTARGAPTASRAVDQELSTERPEQQMKRREALHPWQWTTAS